MRTFIQDVIEDVKNKHTDLSRLVFILPSKRAGYFLKNEIARLNTKTIISPEILSIEEFTQLIAQIKPINNTNLIFEFYEIYLKNTPKNTIEDFESFSKWAQIIIQDFNEIDRYLIDHQKIFNYLSAIKEVSHWSLEEQQTDLIKNYLSFWKKLPHYYEKLYNNLISKNLGYQGLIYRESVEKLEYYIRFNQQKHHVFLGFNALNKAEQTVIEELLNLNLASIYWDVDSAFVDSKTHDAGLFLRHHKKWSYFKSNSFNWKQNNYSKPKTIYSIGVAKNVNQAKYIGQLLYKLHKDHNNLTSTAIVLGDESILTPVLNSIPSEVNSANITMGLPLNNVPLSSLFLDLFKLHKNYVDQKVYYKSVFGILSNSYVSNVLNNNSTENVSKAISVISSNNIIYISHKKIKSLFPNNLEFVKALFGNWNHDPSSALRNCLLIIKYLKEHLSINKKANALSLEYLFKFNQLFNQLLTLTKKNNYVNNISVLFNLYKELLTSETLDFKGEPLKGLQILGMLESRVIDFETVIITSVNEGVLPSGKSNNSFIPFDIKLQYGLPTYKEKDAVYTYHFYHLLQRAKNVYILYNTEVDTLKGGEKSRFITQIKAEGIHNIKEFTLSQEIPKTSLSLKTIKKTDSLLKDIYSIAKKGFSPSSLTSYIRNPIDFYMQKILGVNSFNDVEETLAANTLGTILHNCLEDLYKPFVNIDLIEDHIITMFKRIDGLVTNYFKEFYKEGSFKEGKNLIAFQIIKRYIQNFLNKELEAIKGGNSITILALEKDMETMITIDSLNFPVKLKGTIDRVDLYNDSLRIIDYKTGRVESSKVEIVSWENITTDYNKYSKSFQLLSYALLLRNSTQYRPPFEAGIISFKNLNQGLLMFAKKDTLRSRNKNTLITDETLDLFTIELKKLIEEICNPDIPFTEKET